jgi:hypothetical protein
MICARGAVPEGLKYLLPPPPLPHLQAGGAIGTSAACGIRWESKPHPSRPRLADARFFVLSGTAYPTQATAHGSHVVRTGWWRRYREASPTNAAAREPGARRRARRRVLGASRGW